MVSKASGAVTIRDIARAAGVSATAVSSALHGTGRVSPTLREHIRKLARDMNYEPKVAARLLRARHTGQVGLIMSGTAESIAYSSFFLPIMVHFVGVCELDGIGYHIEFMNDTPGTPFRPPRQLTGGLVDGSILVGFGTPALRQWLNRQNRYPWVNLDEPADFCVLSATDQGVRHAVERLAAKGLRRLAYGSGPSRFTQHRMGLQGFNEAVQAFGLDTSYGRLIEEFEQGRGPEIVEAATAWAERLLTGQRRPEAFICSDMRIARGVLAVAGRRGIAVPESLSVVAVGTAADAEKAYPCLSTIEPDYESLVSRAIHMLGRRIAGKPVEPSTCRVVPRLVFRATTQD